MFTVYVYTLDNLADWELGYITAELNSKRFFKKDAPSISIRMAGLSREPIKTMGGLTILPDCTINDIAVDGCCGMCHLRCHCCAGKCRAAGLAPAYQQRNRIP